MGDLSWPSRASSLLSEYLQQPDVDPKWMQGGGETRPWLCPIYGYSAEIELLDFLYSLIRLIKPNFVIEGGCHVGIGTYALGRAVQDNGSGMVITSDVDPEFTAKARARCQGLPVDVRDCSVMDLPLVEADFVFLDSSYETRIEALAKLKRGCIAVVHDTRQEPSLAEGCRPYPHLNLDQTWRGFSLVRV